MFESLGQTNKSIIREENQQNENDNAIFFNAIHKAERLKKKASLLNKRKWFNIYNNSILENELIIVGDKLRKIRKVGN